METVPEEIDSVARYARFLGFTARRRTVLVEGTTDEDLFLLAARLEHEATGSDLLGEDLAIVAAGVGDRGGTRGVIRELVSLRNMAYTCLLPNGKPRYRFIGLFDNDKAGKEAVHLASYVDNSILEYKDVFRLRPIMPSTGNLDPQTLKKTFERQNAEYTGLDWELEDLLPEDFIDAFVSDLPGAVLRTSCIGGKVHRDFARDGKSRLHRFIKQYAIRKDIMAVIDVLKALRFYLGLPIDVAAHKTVSRH